MPYILLGAFSVISLVSFLITVYDKLASKKLPRWRIRERTLFLLAGIGGAIAMYCTMHLIRHKTKHRSFMIGLPIMIVFQCIAVFICFWCFKEGIFSSLPELRF